MVYLDNAATTPMSQASIEATINVMKNYFGNPSSIHSYGRDAAKILRNSRQTIANILEVKADDLIFTSGGTEANNTAIRGYALANEGKGKHLITTSIEHHSVLHTFEYLRDRHGFEVTFVSPNEGGVITADSIKKALRPDTILVSTMYANNETGSILPIEEIGQLLGNHQAAFHVDAVQAMGKIPVFPKKLGIDFLSASAHKFHGPKGVGFLYADTNKFDKLLYGGDQENSHRPGTENLAAISGMAAALNEANENLESNFNYVKDLKEDLLQELKDFDFYLNQFGPTLPHVLNIGFEGIDHDLLLMRLDLVGIAVSTGSACTAGATLPSHVLSEIYGQNSPKLRENVRISFSEFNTSEDLKKFVQNLEKILGD
ncbi:cysteine desulfurase family protein [Streptococcaceae bacterium ESL0687]|nr:cysteine desulfurase family protein [Streptococcaceae bacterium ESL0687]